VGVRAQQRAESVVRLWLWLWLWLESGLRRCGLPLRVQQHVGLRRTAQPPLCKVSGESRAGGSSCAAGLPWTVRGFGSKTACRQ
jgi:hypothetical protein